MPQSLQIIAAPENPRVFPSNQGSSVAIGVSAQISPERTSVQVNAAANINISSRGISGGIGSVLPMVGAPSSISSIAKGPLTATSIATAAAASVGINTNMPPRQAIETLAPGAIGAITDTASQAISQAISGISFETIRFPAIPGQVSILIGAGPKFLADQIIKYKSIVPPFAPGLKINMAMIGAALSLIRAAASGNLGNIAKSILEDVLEDIKEQSGLADLQNQVQAQLNEVQGAINGVQNIAKNGINVQINASLEILDNAESQYQDQYERENPPQTTIDEDGNTTIVRAPPANTSLYSDLKESLQKDANSEKTITESTSPPTG